MYVLAGPYPVCSPFMVPCLREGRLELLREDVVNKIYGGCPTPCNQLIYERSLSSAFIANHVAQIWQQLTNESRSYLNDKLREGGPFLLRSELYQSHIFRVISCLVAFL